MITQHIKQGENDIRVEVAENVEDAAKNGFKDGEYNRYFVNGKAVNSYMGMIKFIVSESQNTSKKFIPTNVASLREKMINNQRDEIRNQVQLLRDQYVDMKVPTGALDNIDSFLKKIDAYGVRVKE